MALNLNCPLQTTLQLFLHPYGAYLPMHTEARPEQFQFVSNQEVSVCWAKAPMSFAVWRAIAGYFRQIRRPWL